MEERYDPEWQREAQADAVVQDALRSLPCAEPPAGLYLSVMARVAPRHAFERPVFRLSWMDFALSAFFAGMIGLAMLLGGWLPAEAQMLLGWQLRRLQMLHFDWVLWLALGAGAAACVAAAVIFASSLTERTSA